MQEMMRRVSPYWLMVGVLLAGGAWVRQWLPEGSGQGALAWTATVLVVPWGIATVLAGTAWAREHRVWTSAWMAAAYGLALVALARWLAAQYVA